MSFLRGAIREVKEETGLVIELMTQENIGLLQRPNGKSFPPLHVSSGRNS